MLLTVLQAAPSWGPGLPDEVQAYEEALASVRAGAGVTVEEAFLAGGRAVQALHNPDPPGGATLLETLDAAGVSAAVARMPGYVLQRSGGRILLFPDAEFFLALAVAHGDDADRRFFAAYRWTFSRPGQRAWEARPGEGQRCTRYGEVTLVHLYRQWSDHRRLHPDRYASQAAAFLHDIEAELLAGTCPCGSRGDVVRELGAFVDAFPDAAVTAAVRARLQQVQRGAGDIRPACRGA